METLKTFIGASYGMFNLALHAKFHSNVYDVIKVVDITKLNIPKSLLDEYKIHIDQEIELSRQAQGSVITSQLKKIDPLRNADIRYYWKITKAGLLSPVIAQRDAAAKLEIVTRPYSDMQHATYEQKTLLINGMLHDLATEEMQNCLKELSLFEVINDLKKYNDQFNALLMQRTKEQTINKIDNSHISRPKTDNAYKSMQELIYASQLLANNEEDKKMIADLIDHINSFISKAKTECKQTAKRTKNKTEDTTTDNTTNKDDQTIPSENPDSSTNTDTSENPDKLQTMAVTAEVDSNTDNATKSNTTTTDTTKKKKRKATYRLYERPAEFVNIVKDDDSEEKPDNI